MNPMMLIAILSILHLVVIGIIILYGIRMMDHKNPIDYHILHEIPILQYQYDFSSNCPAQLILFDPKSSSDCNTKKYHRYEYSILNG